MAKTPSKSNKGSAGTDHDASQKYQTMLEEVETIVRSVAGGQLDLDQVVQEVERGYTLINTMRHRLSETKVRIETLRQEFEAKSLESQASKSQGSKSTPAKNTTNTYARGDDIEESSGDGASNEEDDDPPF
jgi:exodeoxyribonuclease VII small subunit